MKVYKFGGASVKDALAIKNVAEIIKVNTNPLLVVISAMGKTTNALEDVVNKFFKDEDVTDTINQIWKYHERIVMDLLNNPQPTLAKLQDALSTIPQNLDKNKNFDLVYDQVVSLGEIISTQIVADYLATQSSAQWVDAREYILTNDSFREGKVDWETSRQKIQKLKSLLAKSTVITQGFIGKRKNGLTTTLGRDGSDYSAAIFASCLQAESVTIWKDVPGVMNADPKRLPAATVFSELPFQEAAEMTYYGASVIHPKTIKPLANAGIPLYVKSFEDPTLEGTQIFECRLDRIPPLIVFKDNQCLISCKVTDYTFVSEDQLSAIFKTLSEHEVKINLMQNSAISFSFCADYRENKIHSLIEELSQSFEVYYNTGLTLITIKNYTAKLSEEYRSKPGILVEQLSRSTLQILIRGHAPSAGGK
jgi:aspartate kinase